MTTAYTSGIRLSDQGSGENASTWGTIADNNFQFIDDALTRVQDCSVGLVSKTLTVGNGVDDEARSMTLRIVGAPSSANSVIIPSVEKMYLVHATHTSVAGGIYVGTSAGTGVNFLEGDSKVVYCDGVSVYSIGVDSSEFNLLQSEVASLSATVSALETEHEDFITTAETCALIESYGFLTSSGGSNFITTSEADDRYMSTAETCALVESYNYISVNSNVVTCAEIDGSIEVTDLEKGKLYRVNIVNAVPTGPGSLIPTLQFLSSAGTAFTGTNYSWIVVDLQEDAATSTVVEHGAGGNDFIQMTREGVGSDFRENCSFEFTIRGLGDTTLNATVIGQGSYLNGSNGEPRAPTFSGQYNGSIAAAGFKIIGDFENKGFIKVTEI